MGWTKAPRRANFDPVEVAALLDHVDSSRFDSVLLDLFGSMMPVMEVNGFIMGSPGHGPQPISSCGRRIGTASRVEFYANAFHRFDPTLHSLPSASAQSGTLFNVLMAGHVRNDLYRRTCFEDAALAQKISIAHAIDGQWAILNVYLASPCVDRDDLEGITAFGALAAPFLRRRGQILGIRMAGGMADRADSRIARRLALRFPMLTAREREVCALTIIGKTSGEIAQALGITAGTVLTYRRRAYDRLGVSGVGALVADML